MYVCVSAAVDIKRGGMDKYVPWVLGTARLWRRFVKTKAFSGWLYSLIRRSRRSIALCVRVGATGREAKKNLRLEGSLVVWRGNHGNGGAWCRSALDTCS